MQKSLFLIHIFAIISLFLISCTTIKCYEPYIRYGESCCLDSNNNRICDNDEINAEDNQANKDVVDKIPGDRQDISEKKLMVEVSPLKDSIRLVDQAIIYLIFKNEQESIETYIVNPLDNKWLLRSDPYMQPIRIGVKPGSTNQAKLILQPNRNVIKGKGNYSVELEVTAEKAGISQTVEFYIMVN